VPLCGSFQELMHCEMIILVTAEVQLFESVPPQVACTSGFHIVFNDQC